VRVRKLRYKKRLVFDKDLEVAWSYPRTDITRSLAIRRLKGVRTYEVKLAGTSGPPHEPSREAGVSNITAAAALMTSVKTGKFATFNKFHICIHEDTIFHSHIRSAIEWDRRGIKVRTTLRFVPRVYRAFWVEDLHRIVGSIVPGCLS
jgi:hypothetical protein